MVKRFSVYAVVVMTVGCGGKQESTTPTDDMAETEQPVEADPNAGEADMVPPEKMEEITQLLDRKQRIMSRCLADAVDAKELPANSRGKVTLDIVISPSGKAEKVSVIKATLESKRLEDCVIGHVRQIQFPQLPKEYPTSYTYAFEAM